MKNTQHNNYILNNQYGFTLVEVLIAIVLMSFVAFTTLQITDSSINTKENVTKEDREIVQVVTLMNRLDADFSESYSPLFFDAKESPNVANSAANLDEPSNDLSYFESNKNFYARTKSGFLIPHFTAEEKGSVIFLATAHRRRMEGKKESRFVWIKYSTRTSTPDEDDAEEKRAELELIRQVYMSDVYAKEVDWSKIPPQIILNNIKELEFQFWDERTKKFTANVNDLNENRYNVRSMKVAFTWVDPTKNEQYFEKSFRTLYPYFNPKQDEMLNNQGGSNSNNPFDSSANQGGNADAASNDDGEQQ